MTLRIYVTDLAAYSAGIAHGAWIEVCPDRDRVRAAIAAVLRRSPTGPGAEEWAVHDSEGLPRALQTPHVSIEVLCDFAAFAEEAGADEFEAIARLWDADPTLSLGEACALRAEGFGGTFDTLGDYAAHLCDDANLPAWAAPYVDWAAMGRDMELGGGIFTVLAPGGRVDVYERPTE